MTPKQKMLRDKAVTELRMSAANLRLAAQYLHTAGLTVVASQMIAKGQELDALADGIEAL